MLLPDAHRHGVPQPGTWALCSFEPEQAVTAPAPISLGLHPWNLSQDGLDARLALLEARVDILRPSAIGECGLDHLRGGDRKLQQHAFEAQKEMARRRGLPLVIHCVRAAPELLSGRRNDAFHGIVHGFRGGKELALEFLRHDIRPSFGFALLASVRQQEALRALPEDALFLESDEDPRPLRELYTLAARIRRCDLAELVERIAKNLAELGIVPQNACPKPM